MVKTMKMKKTSRPEKRIKIRDKKMEMRKAKFGMAFILKSLYMPAGIFIDEKLKPFSRLYSIALYAAFVYNTTGAAVTINDEKSHALENFYFVIAALIVMITVQIGRHYEEYLRHLYEEVKRHQETDYEFLHLSNMVIHQRIKTVTVTFAVLIFLVFAIPLYAALFTDAKTDDFVVLIYPMWYPWKRDTMGKYVCSLFIQYASTLVAYYLLLFTVGSFVFATLYIHIRFVILARKISFLNDEIINNRLMNIFGDNNMQNLLEKKFVDLVREHQDLIRFTRKSMACFLPTATIVVTYAFVTAILLITLFLKTDVSMVLKVKLASSSIVAMLALMASCYCGELLMNINKKLKDAVYSLPWYTFSIKLRKSIVIFMTQSQSQFEMRCYGLFLLCVPCIANAYKFCYSCIHFLMKRVQ